MKLFHEYVIQKFTGKPSIDFLPASEKQIMPQRKDTSSLTPGLKQFKTNPATFMTEGNQPNYYHSFETVKIA